MRLLNDHRDKIKTALIAYRFNETAKTLIARNVESAANIYNAVYDQYERSLLQSSAPGRFQDANGLKVQIAGSIQTIWFDGRLQSDGRFLGMLRVPEFDAVTYRIWHKHEGGIAVVIDGGSTLANEHGAIENDAATLRQDIASASRVTEATLAKFHTLEKLLEAWPEIEPFTKALGPKAQPLPPALPVKSLNEMLGL